MYIRYKSRVARSINCKNDSTFIIPYKAEIPKFRCLFLFAIATLIVFCSIALLGGSISGYLARSPSSYTYLQYASAAVMVLLAAWIALRTLR